ncbi:MAG TPA: hypothetical protein VJT73_18005 [Polyangiaceae bacterium]|nr:hypothetical protein [Polyangiaceae bacterium]
MSDARTPLALLGLLFAILAGLGVHAKRASAAHAGNGAAVFAVVRALPGADLAMSGAARHLRFPSLEEPGAAFADGPASIDVDPAGAAVAPPADVYRAVEEGSTRRPLAIERAAAP